MIGVVLDSNIYISALLFGGNPRAIVECAEKGQFGLSVSSPIQDEVARILGGKFSWPKQRATEATSYLWSLAQHVVPKQTVTDCSDPDDNRILERALGADAAVIVTGDSHLLKLHPYRGISILTAKQFLELKPWVCG